MRILLDNCVDRNLLRAFPGHEAIHVLVLGWDQLSNGRLLDAAEEQGFEVLVTVDKSTRFQQSFAKRQISLVVLDSPRIDAMPFIEALLRRLSASLDPGSVVVIASDDVTRQP